MTFSNKMSRLVVTNILINNKNNLNHDGIFIIIDSVTKMQIIKFEYF